MARTSTAIAILAVVFELLFCPFASAVDLPLQQPKWSELNPAQQQALAPLAADWDKLADNRRRKWLGVAERYPNMKPEEQARMQSQMRNWVQLSTAERNRARSTYKTLQHTTPEQREALKQKWEEYQKLPPEEKQRLQELAKKKATPKSAAGKRTAASAHTKPVTKTLNAEALAIPTPPPAVAVPPVPPPVPASIPASSPAATQ